ncbi:MAG: UDP-3-O-(3-hydroxymyristoyl)glucosamine N-acyltransferase [Planctomycetes bacterium]|nr:UDP-3-O-(3-hydroxymyristoyl)glucosamine N-acyltransferase [Planctomycetota bacterium]
MTEASVAAIAELVSGTLHGDGERRIVGLADLRNAQPDRIGFVRHQSYYAAAKDTKAGALLVAEQIPTGASLIVVPDVDVAYAKVAALFHPTPRASEHRVHPTAVVHPEAQIEGPVEIGPHAVIGRCRIGPGCVVMAGVTIGDDCTLGADCVLYPRVTLYHAVTLGNRVICHASSVIGSDGFGFAREGSTYLKVPQLGTVVIEDDVEIGAGTMIDRATLGVTMVHARTKLDNLVHIAHNCTIGYDVVMAGGAMVAGSTSIGDRCVVAGRVGIAGHLKICADTRLGGGSVVIRDIDQPGDYMGHPLTSMRRHMRLLQKLREMVDE